MNEKCDFGSQETIKGDQRALPSRVTCSKSVFVHTTLGVMLSVDKPGYGSLLKHVVAWQSSAEMLACAAQPQLPNLMQLTQIVLEIDDRRRKAVNVTHDAECSPGPDGRALWHSLALFRAWEEDQQHCKMQGVTHCRVMTLAMHKFATMMDAGYPVPLLTCAVTPTTYWTAEAPWSDHNKCSTHCKPSSIHSIHKVLIVTMMVSCTETYQWSRSLPQTRLPLQK